MSDIVATTEFERSAQNGQWYWRTQSPNGEIVGGSMGEGYLELRGAVNGFFAQQGVAADDPAYSRLLKVTNILYRVEKSK